MHGQVSASVLLFPFSSRGEDRILDWVKVADKAGWCVWDSSGEMVFKDQLWILGGWFNSLPRPPRDVWSSPDGKTWNLVTTEAPWKHSDLPMTVVFNDRMWLMGGWYNGRLPGHGASNEVWSSTDGREWEQVDEEHAGWSPRIAAGAVVFKGRVWILGGTEDYYFGDDNEPQERHLVVRRRQGWKREVANAPWSPRAYHAALVHNGKIWVLGGGNYVPQYHAWNDIWSSLRRGALGARCRARHVEPRGSGSPRASIETGCGSWEAGRTTPRRTGATSGIPREGKEWTKLRSKVVWKERHEHSTYVLHDKIWVVGGHAQPLSSEVWSLEAPREEFQVRPAPPDRGLLWTPWAAGC